MSSFGRAKPLPRSCQDMTSKALLVLVEAEKATLQSVFAAAVLLLIKHTVRDLPAASAKLRRINQSLRSSWDRVSDSGVESPPEIDEVSEPYFSVLMWVGKLPSMEIQERMQVLSERIANQGNIPSPDKDDFIRENSPVACGSPLTFLYVLLEEFGMCMVNISPHVFSMCYLFTALKQKGHLTGRWDAIE